MPFGAFFKTVTEYLGGGKQGGVFKQGEGFKHSGTDTRGQLGDPGIRGWVLSRVAGIRESVENPKENYAFQVKYRSTSWEGF